MATTSLKSNAPNFRNAVFEVLGIDVRATNEHDLCVQVVNWITDRKSAYICFADVHSIMVAQNNRDAFDALSSADVVSPDGTPLVWIGKWLNKLPATRVCGPDFMPALIEYTANADIRHYFYGGQPGVAETLAQRFQARFPNLQIAGWDCPPFRKLTSEEEKAAIERINQSKANIVWVGLGAPKQEIWMRDHREQLPGMILLGVGAAFDFHAGLIARAPKWMRAVGLEWLHRLASEPRRLWRRYMVLAPAFIWKVAYRRYFEKIKA